MAVDSQSRSSEVSCLCKLRCLICKHLVSSPIIKTSRTANEDVALYGFITEDCDAHMCNLCRKHKIFFPTFNFQMCVCGSLARPKVLRRRGGVPEGAHSSSFSFSSFPPSLCQSRGAAGEGGGERSNRCSPHLETITRRRSIKHQTKTKSLLLLFFPPLLSFHFSLVCFRLLCFYLRPAFQRFTSFHFPFCFQRNPSGAGGISIAVNKLENTTEKSLCFFLGFFFYVALTRRYKPPHSRCSVSFFFPRSIFSQLILLSILSVSCFRMHVGLND